MAFWMPCGPGAICVVAGILLCYEFPAGLSGVSAVLRESSYRRQGNFPPLESEPGLPCDLQACGHSGSGDRGFFSSVGVGGAYLADK